MYDNLFDEIWNRIVSHAGEPFSTKTGLQLYLRNRREQIMPEFKYLQDIKKRF